MHTFSSAQFTFSFELLGVIYIKVYYKLSANHQEIVTGEYTKDNIIIDGIFPDELAFEMIQSNNIGHYSKYNIQRVITEDATEVILDQCLEHFYQTIEDRYEEGQAL